MIVDANIVVHWFADTEFSNAVELYRERDDLRAPAVILVESANVLYKYSRRGAMAASHCRRSIQTLEFMMAEIVSDSSLLPTAIDLAIANLHPVYDCLYLALAQDREESLLTADKRLASLAKSLGVECHLVEPRLP